MAKRAVSLLLVGKDYPVHGRVYRDFLDMKVVYVFKDNDVTGWLPVTEALMNKWGVTEEELYNEGIQYRIDNETPKLVDLQGLFCRIEGIDELPPLPGIPQQYIFSNGNIGDFSAALILIPKVVETLEKYFGSTLYFIPASIHEWIVVLNWEADVTVYSENLNELISHVNNNVLEDSEILSSHFYTSDELKTALKKFEKAS